GCKREPLEKLAFVLVLVRRLVRQRRSPKCGSRHAILHPPVQNFLGELVLQRLDSDLDGGPRLGVGRLGGQRLGLLQWSFVRRTLCTAAAALTWLRSSWHGVRFSLWRVYFVVGCPKAGGYREPWRPQLALLLRVLRGAEQAGLFRGRVSVPITVPVAS